VLAFLPMKTCLELLLEGGLGYVLQAFVWIPPKNITYLFADSVQSYCEVPQDITEGHDTLKAWGMDVIHLAEMIAGNGESS
jgi:hypothetical protein